MSLSLLTGLAFGVRLIFLLQAPEPLGTDGYYYVVQAEDLLNLGRLHVPDSSWVLYFLAGLHVVIPDPVLAVKVGVSGLAAACVPAAWFAGRAVGRWRERQDLQPPTTGGGWGTAWTLAFWAAASPTLTHLAVDFPKNLGLVAPFLLVIGCTLALDRRRWRLPAAALAILLTAGAHRLGAGLAALCGLGAFLGWLLARRNLRLTGWSFGWRTVALIGAVAVLFVCLSFVLPGLLHPADLERLRGQFDFRPGLPPPFAYFSMRATHPVQQFELGLPWLAVVLGLWAWLRRPERRVLLASLMLPLVVCLSPFWNRDELDMGYRLGLMAPLLAAPVAAAAVPIFSLPKKRLLSVSLLVAGVALVPLSRFGADPLDTPPYHRYRSLIARIPRPLPDLLIAHQGINFLYDHITGSEAMAWAPEPELDRRDIRRLAWGIRDGEWLAYAPDSPRLPRPQRLDTDYVYVREDVWEVFLTRARQHKDTDLLDRLADWHNPTQVRPAAMLRNR